MPKIKLLTHDGKTLNLTQWARLRKISITTIASRLKDGWTIADALDAPVQRWCSRRGGRRAKTAGPRPCPELKRHPTSGLAFSRWYANKKYNYRYFGAWGTPDADRKYRRFAMEWAAGAVALGAVGDRSIGQVVDLWLEHCARTYVKRGKPTSEVSCNRGAMRHLADLYGDTPAAEFTTPLLRATREAMVAEGWARKTINSHVSRIVRAFEWAAGEQLVPQSVHQGLSLLESLVAGRRADVPEAEPVDPVPVKDIEAVLAGDHLHPNPKRRAVLAAMIRVQHYNGLRPGELCGLRAGDIDRSQVPWRYGVTEYNKMLHKDIKRTVFFGPKTRAELAPLLAECPDDAHVFRLPPFRKGAKWTAVSVTVYRERIAEACKASGATHWSPNQLRHNKATEVMDTYENDRAAAAVLGNTPEVARQVYAHRAGESVAKRIAEETG